MRFNLIGAGRLGAQIAYHLLQQGHSLIGIYNQHLTSTHNIVHKLGQGTAVTDLSALEPADVLFITTPDQQIASIVAQLAHNDSMRSQIVVHCSGLHSSAILSPLKRQHCQIASLHPLKAFPQGRFDADIFQNCYCSCEGDQEAMLFLTNLFATLGAVVFPINSEHKKLYHAAAVIASNYPVTLAEQAMACFKQAGITDECLAKSIIIQLMQSCIENMKNQENLASALTGPIARGDQYTVEKHLEALKDLPLNHLYRQLGLATLELTNLKKSDKEALSHILAVSNLS